MTTHIVQISDTHISSQFPQRTKDLENCVTAINALVDSGSAPALVVHTGDVSHEGSTEEYHIAKQQLDKLHAPYVVMVGNRDKRAELLSVFSANAMQPTCSPWVQYAINDFPVRLLMVDTLSTQSNKGQLCEERLAHLETMLDANPTKPTALFLHHPPYPATGIPDPYQYEDWDDVEKLTALLSRFDNIQAIYCGHVHRFVDGEIAGINASAITCSARDLRKGEMTEKQSNEPVFKSILLHHS